MEPYEPTPLDRRRQNEDMNMVTRDRLGRVQDGGRFDRVETVIGVLVIIGIVVLVLLNLLT